MKIILSSDLKRNLLVVGATALVLALWILAGLYAPYRIIETEQVVVFDGTEKIFAAAVANGLPYILCGLVLLLGGRSLLNYLSKNIFVKR